MNRRQFLTTSIVSLYAAGWPAPSATAGIVRPSPQDVLCAWYDLTLELVRHTATYSPPVAARAFAYLGVVAFEAVASGSTKLTTLAGQLPELQAVPKRQSHLRYDDALVLHAALKASVASFFQNTGPAGQRAMTARARKLDKELAIGLKPAVLKRSTDYGHAIAQQVFKWSQNDGGADVELMGFASDYKLNDAAGHWKPTGSVRLQQLPLLPKWGSNRSFTLSSASACALPPPPAYSEDQTSAFYKEALEVYEVTKSLTPEQILIARFWSDDPMLSPTPPGHWLFIALDILKSKTAPIEECVDVLARLGLAVSDAFVACWKSKYEYDLLRPVTYIKKIIDKSWEPRLITPPFPEYPSGHSTQSGAAATVLSQAFGENFDFEDKTHVREKFKGRTFKSFWEAAEEAAISRLYGGIHFRSAAENGLEQGRCVGLAVNALRTKVKA
jgi:membrane-associated phospholipid phosphatase